MIYFTVFSKLDPYELQTDQMEIFVNCPLVGKTLTMYHIVLDLRLEMRKYDKKGKRDFSN